MTESRHEVAVLVPCYNEARAIAKVVADFRAALPDATIYVYDNNSTDGTVEAAQQAGAVVRRETHQGKGHVVRRMFNDIEADIYVLVDGDATYDAPSAPAMIEKLIGDRLDMVVASRIDRDAAAYRPGHRTGNAMLTGFITHIFGRAFTDILSGYRVFSRRFVKSFPILTGGFEIETELTVHALELELPVGEIRNAVLFAAGRVGLETVDLARRLSHPVDCAETLPRRAAAGFVRLARHRARHHVDRPRHPAGHHLCAGRSGAAAAHGGALDRADAGRLPLDRLRPHSRYRDARPPRGEADCLSGAARAGRRTTAELKPCAN